MNNTSKLLLAVSAVALLAAATPLSVSAQTTLGFGTQVKLGDVDFRPTAVGAQAAVGLLDSAAQPVRMIDFGTTGDVTDNCVYFDLAAGGTVTNFDVRLTPCQGNAAGTLIQDANTVEKASAFFAPAATSDSIVRFADVNNNGRYDSGDCVFYVQTTESGVATAPPNIVASTGNNQFTVRLTPCSGKSAGTLVFASDPDFTAYGAATTAIASATSGVAIFDADNTGALTSGDSAYFVPTAVVAGGLFPQFSVRLVGGSGAFGTQVKLGDLDFVPIGGLAANVAAAVGNIRNVDFGVTGDVTDNCLYYDADAAGAGPTNFDVRLTACQGNAAGTLVLDTHTVEKASAFTAAAGALSTRFADVNNNGRYDMADCVFITTNAANIIASTGNALWTVRMTGCSGKSAGTLVFAGDADLNAYGAATTALGASGFNFFNADNTAAGGVATFTAGDLMYLAPTAVAVGSLFPQYSVRVSGGTAAFGTQIKLGDADFVPTLIAPAIANIVTGDAETDFGVTAQVTDNCFYYDILAPTTAVTNFNVRLTDCQGKKAGSMVMDADTVEKATASIDATANAAGVNFADVNNNGRYDAGDCVFFGTGAANAMVASTGLAAWTLRLTACGSSAAGTLVFASDADFTSYRAASPVLGPGTGVVGYFDGDNTATITEGDVVYVLPGAAIPANGLIPLYSVRISGTPTASGPNPGGSTSTSTSVSSTSTSTSVSSTSQSSTPQSSTSQSSSQGSSSQNTVTGTSSSTTQTPGFELVALVGVLAAALVLVRRKL